MKFRIGRGSSKKAKDAAADAKKNTHGELTTFRSPDHKGSENGSKEEAFFEAKPWLDSDSEDDFHSVRGEFTPSRGSTPNHPNRRSLSGRTSVDRLKPFSTEKKQKLLELLQEKQQFDDDELVVTANVSAKMENGIVHVEQHLNSSQKDEKEKKYSKAGCLPSNVWKFSFRNCRKKRKNQKSSVN